MADSTQRLDQLTQRIEASFGKQGIMATLGARLARIAYREVDIELAASSGLTQQRRFIHAGVIATIADSAGGYAALTTMAPDDDVVAVEFKLNLLKPAVGDRFVARGTVIKSGANICVCTVSVVATRATDETLVAFMTQTNFRIRPDTDYGSREQTL